MGWDRAHTWEIKDAYTILVRKPHGKRPPERSGLQYEDNVKMDLREIV
jgi:hypothetical protein